jgi:hypothetical protein
MSAAAHRKPHAAKRTVSLLDGRTDTERPRHLGRDGNVANTPQQIVHRPPQRPAWVMSGPGWLHERSGYRVEADRTGGLGYLVIRHGRVVHRCETFVAAQLRVESQ